MSTGRHLSFGLPLLLEAGPREFAKWSDAQSLREQEWVTPTEPLYHYTDEAALRGILSNEVIWCFSHLDQSDQEEFSYSRGVALRELRRLEASGDVWVREFALCVQDLLRRNELSNIFSFFLFAMA